MTLILRAFVIVCCITNQSHKGVLKMAELKITKANFESEVLQSEKPVMLDFWAEWCGPCRMLAPFVKEVADEYEGKIKVGKVNIDEEPELASAFHIESIPTVVIVKNGKVACLSVGYMPKSQLVEMIEGI